MTDNRIVASLYENKMVMIYALRFVMCFATPQLDTPCDHYGIVRCLAMSVALVASPPLFVYMCSSCSRVDACVPCVMPVHRRMLSLGIRCVYVNVFFLHVVTRGVCACVWVCRGGCDIVTTPHVNSELGSVFSGAWPTHVPAACACLPHNF